MRIFLNDRRIYVFRNIVMVVLAGRIIRGGRAAWSGSVFKILLLFLTLIDYLRGLTNTVC